MNKPQPTSWKFPLVAVLAIVALAVGLYFQRPREFEYQGKRLTRWLDDLDQSQPPATRDAASQAVQQMGTNIVPSLLAMLKAAPSYSKRQLASSLGQAESAHHRALAGFQALGAQAIAALTNYLVKPETAVVAAHAISQVGPDGVSPLLRALTNNNAIIRQRVELGLESNSTGGQPLVSALIQNLRDSDDHVRAYAALALGKLNLEPGASVSALTGALQDKNSEVRSAAAESLGQFGPKATAAILPLLNVTKDKDAKVSDAAFRALTLIDPEAARKAGVN